MKRSNRLFLLVGIVLAVVAALGVLLLSGGGTQPPAGGPTVPPTEVDVVVAASDVPLGSVLAEGQLTTQRVPTAQAPTDALTSIEQAEGRTVRTALREGDVITESVFGAQDATAEQVKGALAQGFRAIAVQVDQISGVGTLIQPGDRVDVILSMTDADGKFPLNFEGAPTESEAGGDTFLIRNFVPADGNINNTSIKVLVQNAQVLGTLLPPPPAEQGQAQPTEGTDTDTDTALTGRQQIAILAVTPQQVELVRFAQLDGNLSLVLRATADSTPEAPPDPTTGITLRELVDTYGVIPSNLILINAPPPLEEP